MLGADQSRLALAKGSGLLTALAMVRWMNNVWSADVVLVGSMKYPAGLIRCVLRGTKSDICKIKRRWITRKLRLWIGLKRLKDSANVEL